MDNRILTNTLLAIGITTVLAACGGSGGSSEPVSSAVVSGKAAKGIIIKGNVVAAELNDDGSVKNANVGSGITDSDGKYSLTLNNSYDGGPIEISVTADAETTMVCDATSGCGTSTNLSLDTIIANGNTDFGEQYHPSSLMMTALIPKASQGDKLDVQVTPFTDMAARRARTAATGTALNADAINQANTSVSNLLGVDILKTEPVDITKPANLTGGNQAAVSYAALSASILKLAPVGTDPNHQPDLTAALTTLANGFANGSMVAADNSATDFSLDDIVSGATATLTKSDPAIITTGFTALVNIKAGVDQAVANANGGIPVITPNNGTQGVFTQIYASRAATSAECSSGGQVIQAWFDKNDNGLLDSTETPTDYVVCNGIDGIAGADGVDGATGSQGLPGTDGGSTITTVAATTAQCPAGGVVITIDTNSFQLCNGSAGTSTAEDFPAARTMITGFKTYIAGLEALNSSLTEYSTNLDAQSVVLKSMYDESLSKAAETIGLVMLSIANIYDANKDLSVDNTYNMAEALALSTDMLDGTSDLSFQYTAATKQVSITAGSTITLNDVAGTGTIANIVTFGSVTLPGSTTGTSFAVSFNNVTASNSKATLSVPLLSAEITTTNSLNLSTIATTEPVPGRSTLTLDFGDAANKLSIQNITTVADEEFSFEGFVHAELVYIPADTFYTISGQRDLFTLLPKDIQFNGALTSLGVTSEVNLAANVANADSYAPVGLTPAILAAADSSGLVQDYLTLSVTDITSNYASQTFASGKVLIAATKLNPVQLTDFGINSGYSCCYSSSYDVLLSLDTTLDGNADLYIGASSYWSLDQAESSGISSSSQETAISNGLTSSLQSHFYNRGLGDWYLHYDPSNHYVDAFVSIDLSAITSALLTAGSISLPLHIEDADDFFDPLDKANTSFTSFPKLTASAGLILTGLKDTIDDSPLDPLDITLTADMTHYLDYLNTIKIDFAVAGNSFSAKMNFTHLDDDNYVPGMNFQDNAGGRIDFKDLSERFTYNNYGYVESSYAIGDIYYNNIHHGKLYINYYEEGNVYVAWDDGTEELIYSYSN